MSAGVSPSTARSEIPQALQPAARSEARPDASPISRFNFFMVLNFSVRRTRLSAKSSAISTWSVSVILGTL